MVNIMEKPIQMDDLGGATILGNIHISSTDPTGYTWMIKWAPRFDLMINAFVGCYYCWWKKSGEKPTWDVKKTCK